MSFTQALLSSIPRLLFLMLVCLGFAALIAFPVIGERLGGLVCESGQSLTSVTTPYSLPGQSGTTIEYFCVGPEGRQSVGLADMAIAVLKVYVAIFLLIIWPLLAFLKGRKEGYGERMRRDGVPATVTIISARQTMVRINDAPLVKFELKVEPEGMPAFTKSLRKTVHAMNIPHMQPGARFQGLVDPKRPRKVLILFDQSAGPQVNTTFQTVSMDQLPPQFADLVAQARGAAGGEASATAESSSSAGFGESSDEVDALRALKAMHDEGLISDEDFAAKKAEIMGRM